MRLRAKFEPEPLLSSSSPFPLGRPDTQARAFQYKVLNNKVFTNPKLYKFKIVELPLCTFYGIDDECHEQLLVLCKVTDVFWKEVLSW